MANSFSQQIIFNRQTLLAVVIPQLKKDGMHYEININGYPRFHMSWSALGRYDITDDDRTLNLPYEIILAVSDTIEARVRKKDKK